MVSVAFYLARPYLERSESAQNIELKKAMTSQTLPLRLQAYERVVLLIERLNPANMLIRLNGPYTAAELHSLVISEIRNEYQHNVTQQLYVSARAWHLVKRIKEDTLVLVNSAGKSMPENANGLDLSRAILKHLSTQENDPYEIALSLVKSDMEELF